MEAHELLPLRVSTVDQMIDLGGVERGSTILLSGGCGSGKTIFAMQSVYNAALNGEKSLYLTFEEGPHKIRYHMKRSFGWDIEGMEKKGLICLQKINSLEFLTQLKDSLREAELRKNLLDLDICLSKDKFTLLGQEIDLPLSPDRVVMDSVSALSILLDSAREYRLFLKIMVDALNQNNSLNVLINETTEEPMAYSKVGVEEFLVDGVIGLYNIRKGQLRRRAIEIVKLRSSDHLKEMVPYNITKDGIKILMGESLT
jgi:KaiC/GvpD/RAD55 family RecA-like ATPase